MSGGRMMVGYGRNTPRRFLVAGLLMVGMVGATGVAQARPNPASGGGNANGGTYGGAYGAGYNGDSRLDNYGPSGTMPQYSAPEMGTGSGDGIPGNGNGYGGGYGDGGGIQPQSTIPGGSSEAVPGMGSPDGGTFSNMNMGGVDSSAPPGMN
ncbi:hypothetical protein [Novacetimonas pomaceti]|uniref:hypothetical protein n=1 Tax=Novacetimonas pomaceti TaxID=2021998 RepID=UPI001C2D109E|nr:hypothetical protein [Novacetimonas pomaceti]MBV1835205.1 hypothetical protein [Novacetimonas pomaceti]